MPFRESLSVVGGTGNTMIHSPERMQSSGTLKQVVNIATAGLEDEKTQSK
jgi:hypothetical protein